MGSHILRNAQKQVKVDCLQGEQQVHKPEVRKNLASLRPWKAWSVGSQGRQAQAEACGALWAAPGVRR